MEGLVKRKLEEAEQSEFAGKTLRELLGLLPEKSVERSKEITDFGAHNIILTAFADHADGSTIPPTDPDGLSDAQIQSLEKAYASAVLQLEQLRASGIGEQMLELFKPYLDDPSKVLDISIGDLLKVVAKALESAFDLAEGLVQAFFATVGEFIQNCHDFLLAPWDIPLITPLYKRITQQAGVESNLTVLGVFSLMLAVPATPAMKLITGHAPFPDEAALAEFEAAYTVNSLRQSADISSLSRAATGGEIVYRSGAATWVAVRAVAIALTGALGMISDFQALALQKVPLGRAAIGNLGSGVEPGPLNLNALTAIGCAVSSGVVWATQCPWLIDCNAGNFDISTAQGKANLMWVGRSFIQMSRLLLAIATSRTEAQVFEIGPWLASGVGLGNFVLNGSECYLRGATVAEWLSRCLPAIPEMSRFGLDDEIAIQTKSNSVKFVIISEGLLAGFGVLASWKVLYDIQKS